MADRIANSGVAARLHKLCRCSNAALRRVGGVVPILLAILALSAAAYAQVPTTTTLTVSNNNPTYNTPPYGGYATTLNPVTITATVTVTATGQPVPSGSVTFYDDAGVPNAAAPDAIGTSSIQTYAVVNGTGNGAVNGAATLVFAFGPGSHSLTAVYSGTTGVPGFGNLPGTPNYQSSTTAIPYALTSNGYAAEYYGFQIIGSEGASMAQIDPQSFTSPQYYILNQDPVLSYPFMYGFGLQVPQGSTTVTDNTTGIIYPMTGNGVLTTNFYYKPQFAVYNVDPGHSDDAVQGNYVYVFPANQNAVNYFFTADVFQSGVPAVITVSAAQKQIWTNPLQGPNTYSGCDGGQTACAVTTPPVQGVAADVNGDGRLDLVIAHSDPTGNGSVGIFTNTLNLATCGSSCSAFSAPEVTYATGHPVSYVAVGDVNGDGYPDIVAVSSDGSNLITVLLNNGDGTFRPTGASFSAGNGASQLALGDFNQDGFLDIAVLNKTDATIGILNGNGDGTFSTMVPYAVGTNPTAFSMADLNLDGYPDFAITNNDSPTQAEVSFLYGQAGGGFNYVTNLTQNQLYLNVANYPETNPEPTAIQATDLNGDGYPDLFIGFNINQYTYAIYNPASGQYQYAMQAETDNPNGINLRTNSAAVTDVDGDGLKDFLLMTTVNNEEVCSGCLNYNLMFRMTGANVYQWQVPDVVASPSRGVHDFISTFTPTANSIYSPTTAGPISLLVTSSSSALTPTSFDFGTLPANATSPPQTFTLTNTGLVPFVVTSGALISGVSSSSFSVVHDGCFGASLAPQQSCTVTITFTPTDPDAASYSATLIMADQAADSPQVATLAGAGAAAIIAVPLNISETITVADGAPRLVIPVPLQISEAIHIADAAPSLIIQAPPTPLNIVEAIHIADGALKLAVPVALNIIEGIHMGDSVPSLVLPTPLSIVEAIHIADGALKLVEPTTLNILEAIRIGDSAPSLIIQAPPTPLNIVEAIHIADGALKLAVPTALNIVESIRVGDSAPSLVLPTLLHIIEAIRIGDSAPSLVIQAPPTPLNIVEAIHIADGSLKLVAPTVLDILESIRVGDSAPSLVLPTPLNIVEAIHIADGTLKLTLPTTLNIIEAIHIADAAPSLVIEALPTPLNVVEAIHIADAAPKLVLPTLLNIAEIVYTADTLTSIKPSTLLNLAELVHASDTLTSVTPSTLLSLAEQVHASDTLTSIKPSTLLNLAEAIHAVDAVNAVADAITPVLNWPAPNVITYGTALSAAQLNATVSIAGTDITSGGLLVYTATPQSGGATQAITTGSLLGAGTYTLAVTWKPANSALYNQITGTTTLLVRPAVDTVQVISNLASGNPLTSFVFTARVNSAVAGAPAGSVTFTVSNGSTFGPYTVVNGSASGGGKLLAASNGTLTVTANYSGDANYAANTGTTAITIGTANFTLIAVPPSLTIARAKTSSPGALDATGHSASTTITMTPVFGYTGSAAFACNGLPAYASCSFSPAALVADGSNTPVSTVLTVYTLSSSVRSGTATSAFWIPGTLLALLLCASRRHFTRRIQHLLLLALLATAAVGVTACGTGNFITPAGATTSTVVVNATGTVGTGSGDQQQNLSITITVQ